MNLRVSALSLASSGYDVRRLQLELRQLGFTIDDHEAGAATFGETTRAAVQQFQQANGLSVTGVVDEATAARINAQVEARFPFVVRGVVRQTEEPLGDAMTDDSGRYEIRYTAEKFSRAEKGSADLRVAMSNPEGRELASSPIRFNAGAQEMIDLVVDTGVRGPSDYERELATVEPLLQGLSLAGLKEDDQHQD
ncbi:MAG: hypothetical protein DMD72_02995, partial [Gemmatimonadetes bacterium]